MPPRWATCGMSLPAVPGLLGAASLPVCWTSSPTRRCGSSSGASRWAASSASPRVGRTGKAAGRRAARAGSDRSRSSPNWVRSTIWCIVRRSTTSPSARPSSGPPTSRAPAPSSRWRGGWTPRCTTCRRSPWRATSAASTPRTTSTSASSCRRPITRRSSRPRRWCATRPGCGYRIYRPAVVVGDSRTGEMDKIDGPYYFFGVLAKLAVLPSFTPMLLPDTGRTNIVPVDYVADALVALMHTEGPGRADVPPDRAQDHRTARHLPRDRRCGRIARAARVAAPLGGAPRC